MTLIALDVDGVLNLPGAPGHTAVHLVDMPADSLPKHRWLRGYGEERLSVQVHLNPAHGALIRRWQKLGADVRWCTTWGDAANTFIAPLLGIDPLPVVPFWEPPSRPGEYLGDVKLGYLQHHFPRPLVWVDDMVTWSLQSPYMLTVPIGKSGITPAVKGQIARFLRRHEGMIPVLEQFRATLASVDLDDVASLEAAFELYNALAGIEIKQLKGEIPDFGNLIQTWGDALLKSYPTTLADNI